MRLRTLLAAPAAALALTACAGTAPPGCANLPGGGRYCLQSTAGVPPFEAVQTVTAEGQGGKHTMIASVESDAAGLRIAGLTPFGQKLLAASYDNSTVRAEAAPALEQGLDATLLLALLQLALWPEREAAAGLAPPLRLVSDPDHRWVREGARTLLAIDREGTAAPFRRLRISLPEAGLTLTVETLPDATPPKAEP